MEENKPVDKMINKSEENIIKRTDSQGNEYETKTQNIELSVSTILPGTSLTVPAYDKDGNLIKEANKEFTEEDINNLKSYNIKTIYYSLKSSKKVKSNTQAQKMLIEEDNVDQDTEYIISKEKLYEKLDMIKGIFQKTKENDKVEMSEVYNIVDFFYNSIKEKNKYKLLLLKSDLAKNADDYLYSSAINTCLLSMLVGREAQPNDKLSKNLGIAGLLHDIGLVKLPSNLITKPANKFTEKEIKQYKEHPDLSSELIEKSSKYIGVDPFIIQTIKQHQEHYNGTGFPNKLKGNMLDPIKTIVSLSDMFDYLTRSPALNKHLNYREALVFIHENMKKIYEPKIAGIFIKTVFNRLKLDVLFGKDYYLLLNTGEIAIVEEENQYNILKPKLRIIADKTGKQYTKMYRVDLKTDLDREIIKVKKRNTKK
ncbi:MAG: HD-GYP domain-containing protein [bacterium]